MLIGFLSGKLTIFGEVLYVTHTPKTQAISFYLLWLILFTIFEGIKKVNITREEKKCY